MAILLMFNTQDSYRVQELMDATKLKLEVMSQVNSTFKFHLFLSLDISLRLC